MIIFYFWVHQKSSFGVVLIVVLAGEGGVLKRFIYLLSNAAFLQAHLVNQLVKQNEQEYIYKFSLACNFCSVTQQIFSCFLYILIYRVYYVLVSGMLDAREVGDLCEIFVQNRLVKWVL